MKPLHLFLFLLVCSALTSCQTLDRVLTIDNVARALEILDHSQAIYDSAQPPATTTPEK